MFKISNTGTFSPHFWEGVPHWDTNVFDIQWIKLAVWAHLLMDVLMKSSSVLFRGVLIFCFSFLNMSTSQLKTDEEQRVRRSKQLQYKQQWQNSYFVVIKSLFIAQYTWLALFSFIVIMSTCTAPRAASLVHNLLFIKLHKRALCCFQHMRSILQGPHVTEFGAAFAAVHAMLPDCTFWIEKSREILFLDI